MASCSGSGCIAPIFLVPLGKRLVIEYASIAARIPAGKVARWEISSSLGGQSIRLNFPLTQPPVVDFSSTITTAGQQVRLYADPESDVSMIANTSDNANPSNFNFAISGYLVDVP